jgi:prepilin-type N-terminal cleavage/methylation domain-containing protein
MKKYSGFTLIEMLIVMGIIIILMAAGIAGGRFALQRANRIQKQSAVDNIEQALWGYYTDNRGFPREGANGLTDEDLWPGELMTGALSGYIDAGQFDGGTDGHFYYFVEPQGQEFVVCATLGGSGDEMQQGIYCTGNGLTSGSLGGDNGPFDPSIAPIDNIYRHEDSNDDFVTIYNDIISDSDSNGSYWNGDTRGWE